ncbi:electron transfer flavoprotein subunit beta/FixA family protein [Thermodesulfobacteriota bacterium]
MALSLAVFIKQVPDTTAVTARAMKADGTLNRSALPAVFNPEDLHALELALELKDRCGGSVCAVTMGPVAAAEILREALYRGADRACLITDRRFAAADTLATSYVLSKAAAKLGPFDIIICGRQAIDGNTAQVGPQVAQKLGLNQLTYVEAVEQVADGTIRAWRDIEEGKELVQSRLPVLITVTDSANTPRPPSVKRIMQYKNAQAPSELSADTARNELEARGLLIEELHAEAIGVDDNQCGLAGSPTRVKKIASVVLKGKDYKRIEPTDAGLRELLQELIAEYTFD